MTIYSRSEELVSRCVKCDLAEPESLASLGGSASGLVDGILSIMYVDDMLIIGKKEQIQDFASEIQQEFSVKIQHNLADYLGCEFHMNKERTRGWLGHPSIIKSLEQNFGDRAMKERLSLTPGTPRFTARRLENLEDKVNPEDHETYRSEVGTLLYLTKHSRPDICNPVRELSKTIDAPAPVHLKEMY